METAQPRADPGSGRGLYLRMSTERKKKGGGVYFKKMTEPRKTNSFQEHLEMKAVYSEKQENGRTLLLVTERTEELLPRGNRYL